MLTVRFYAQINILNNYSKLINDILSKYHEKFNILPSICLGSRFTFKSNEENDISIVIMKELETTREPQTNWFLRMVDDIVKNTKKHILIVVFSDMEETVTKERKIIYEQQIKNSSIYYLDLDDWPSEEDDDEELQKCIDSYLMNLINNI